MPGGNEDDIIFADLVTGVSNEILQVSTAAEKKFVKLVAVEGYIVISCNWYPHAHPDRGCPFPSSWYPINCPTGSQDAIDAWKYTEASSNPYVPLKNVSFGYIS